MDTTTVHLSIAGSPIKTVPSRLSAVDLARLRRLMPVRPGSGGSAEPDDLFGFVTALGIGRRCPVPATLGH
jgi:hypothetical protein